MGIEQEKTAEELLKVLEMQEEILQFTHFTNSDAWELGSLMAAEARRRELPAAISICLNNGVTVFRYMADQTTPNNELRLKKKAKAVKMLEISSLRLFMKLKIEAKPLEDFFLDEKEFSCGGGGFPIRIEEVGVIGAILVSGMNHVADHDFIIKCLGKYLHTDEVPRIKEV